MVTWKPCKEKKKKKSKKTRDESKEPTYNTGTADEPFLKYRSRPLENALATSSSSGRGSYFFWRAARHLDSTVGNFFENNTTNE